MRHSRYQADYDISRQVADVNDGSFITAVDLTMDDGSTRAHNRMARAIQLIAIACLQKLIRPARHPRRR